MDGDKSDAPQGGNWAKITRGALNITSGAIPFVGGALSATAAAWSEYEQDQVNTFLKYRQEMFEKELAEQLRTIHEITQRLDKIDLDVSERVKSSEFQNLVERCFRNWSNINTEAKISYIRNMLVNAASTSMSSDDVVRLFIDWVNQYSELHFQVIACIYKHLNGISRGRIWDELGKAKVREDSADADLYKLLIRDLSTGGIIRQYRQTDYNGDFIKVSASKPKPRGSSRTMESAFDASKQYTLTELGKQFVHYAMIAISTKIEYQKEACKN
jgi:hypothetical protein